MPTTHANPMTLPVTFLHRTDVQTKSGRRAKGYTTWEASYEGQVIAFNEDLKHLRKLFPNGMTEQEQRAEANRKSDEMLRKVDRGLTSTPA